MMRTKPGRPKTPEDIEKQIVEMYKEHPGWSLRKLSENVGNVSYVTVMKVLRERNLWIPGRNRDNRRRDNCE